MLRDVFCRSEVTVCLCYPYVLGRHDRLKQKALAGFILVNLASLVQIRIQEPYDHFPSTSC